MKRNIKFCANLWNWIRGKCHTIKIQWPEENEQLREQTENNEQYENQVIQQTDKQIEREK